jgi:hypothetical protein
MAEGPQNISSFFLFNNVSHFFKISFIGDSLQPEIVSEWEFDEWQ